MSDDPEVNNPKTIWQNQPAENSKMSLEEIRFRARMLHAKTRRELQSNITMAVIALAVSIFGIAQVHVREAQVVFGLAIGWALAGQYFVHRGMWSEEPGAAELSSGAVFYRRQIEQQLSLFRRALRWSLGPLLLSIATVAVGLAAMAEHQRGSVRAVLPFCTLFVIWIILFFILRSRGQRTLRRELAELNGLG